jgi:hypothetical protein
VDIPEFVLEDDNYLNLPANLSIENITPTLGDLDGDGDMDLLFGDDDGSIYHYENISTTGTANFVYVTDIFQGISVGSHSAPHLVDYNGDGKLDLLVGNNRGYVYYFQNNGSATAPALTLITDTLGQIKINDFTGQTFSNGFSRPFLFDYDNDAQRELLVGTVSGTVEIFELGTSPTDSFLNVGRLMNFDFGSFAAPCAGVIDSLGATYLVGVHRGGLMLVGDPYPLSVGFNQDPIAAGAGMTVYPNPNAGLVAVRFQDPQTQGVLQVCNLLGQTLHEQPIRATGEMQMDLRDLPNGLYLLRAATTRGVMTQKIIVRR